MLKDTDFLQRFNIELIDEVSGNKLNSTDLIIQHLSLGKDAIKGTMSFFNRKSLLRMISPLDPVNDNLEDEDEKKDRLRLEAMDDSQLRDEVEDMYLHFSPVASICLGIPTELEMTDLDLEDLNKIALAYGLKEIGKEALIKQLLQVEGEILALAVKESEGRKEAEPFIQWNKQYYGCFLTNCSK